MPTPRTQLRLVLLQVRNELVSLKQEQSCFIDRCRVARRQFDFINLVDNPNIRWRDIEHAHAVLIGGAGALTPHTDIMLRLESDPGDEDAPELYANVIRPVDEPREGFLIHFTSVSHGMQERISRLTGGSRNA